MEFGGGESVEHSIGETCLPPYGVILSASLWGQSWEWGVSAPAQKHLCTSKGGRESVVPQPQLLRQVLCSFQPSSFLLG